LTFRKKPWGQLAPKFSDLVASTSILVAKNFRPFGPYIFPKKEAKTARNTSFSWIISLPLFFKNNRENG
jgi:hypothetical protein